MQRRQHVKQINNNTTLAALRRRHELACVHILACAADNRGLHLQILAANDVGPAGLGARQDTDSKRPLVVASLPDL